MSSKFLSQSLIKLREKIEKIEMLVKQVKFKKKLFMKFLIN